MGLDLSTTKNRKKSELLKILWIALIRQLGEGWRVTPPAPVDQAENTSTATAVLSEISILLKTVSRQANPRYDEPN